MDVGPPEMERIQTLAPKKFLLFFFLAPLLGAACATKVTPEQLADIRRNDEFESAIKVQQIEPSTAVDSEKRTEERKPKKDKEGAPRGKNENNGNNGKKEEKPTPPPAPVKKDVVAAEEKKETPAPEAAPTEPALIEPRADFDPFRVGQKASMNVAFSGISAGTVELRVNPFLEVNGERAYHFSTHAKSNSLFSFFYSVDDWAETYVRYRDFLPLSFAVHVNESRQVGEVRSYFDWQSMTAKYWEKTIRRGKKKEKNLSWEILPQAQNVISAFFFLRLLPYEPGKKMVFRVADEGKNIAVHMETAGKERVKTDAGEFDAFLTKVRFEYNGVFKQTGDVSVWIIDDEYRHIARLEAKIKLGTMSLSLREIVNGESSP